MNTKFLEYRKNYKEIIYKSYDIKEEENDIVIIYYFDIPGLCEFHPTLTFSKSIIRNEQINDNLVKKMVFHIGMIELISYYKCCCLKKFPVVHCTEMKLISICELCILQLC